ncbi:jerky protein homolog-like [Bombus pascuorum]|uniref:jerky protein homolog-like n=1 Tax=Bombus pascuorum TaxID=65598 RepID=UPI0021398326|nr:jerky protein homolog-like [Bombus pascuorum]
MPPKRRRSYLSNADKYDIIKMKDRGVHRKIILKKYGISLSCLSHMSAKREEIIRQYEISRVTRTCTSKSISCRDISDLEEIVYHWFIQCRTHDIKITGADVRHKAQEINKKLNLHPHFKGNKDWVRIFRERHCITEEDIQRDFPTTTQAGTKAFKDMVKECLDKGQWTLENVYNVIYTPIMWKLVPEKTEIFQRAKSTGNEQMIEDHVIALLCVNATGCHKLPILIIGTEKENHKLYNFKTNIFSTIYKSKSNPCMDSTIFDQWFEDHFLTSVREKQNRGERQKTVLLLDNARSLHDLKNLNKKDNFVTVISIPNDVSRFVLPINCGILTCFIRKYRKELAKTLEPLPTCNTEDEVIDIHKNLNLWDCCRIVDKAWSKVDDIVIRNAWDTLLKRRNTHGAVTKEDELDVYKTYKSLRELPGCLLCDETDVQKWFEVDRIDKIIMKIYTDEVIRDFQTNTLGVGIVDDEEAGPSHS